MDETHLVENREGIGELRVTVRLRNNRLVTLREQKGLSQPAAAEAIGISADKLAKYEKMVMSPVTSCGAWRDCALKICVFYAAQPDWLWSDTVRAVKRVEATMVVSAADTQLLAEYSQDPMKVLEDAEEVSFVHRVIDGALEGVRDKRLRDIADLRLKSDEYTLDDLAKKFGTNRERVRQLEGRLLCRIRDFWARAEAGTLPGKYARAEKLVDEQKKKETEEERFWARTMAEIDARRDEWEGQGDTPIIPHAQPWEDRRWLRWHWKAGRRQRETGRGYLFCLLYVIAKERQMNWYG